MKNQVGRFVLVATAAFALTAGWSYGDASTTNAVPGTPAATDSKTQENNPPGTTNQDTASLPPGTKHHKKKPLVPGSNSTNDASGSPATKTPQDSMAPSTNSGAAVGR